MMSTISLIMKITYNLHEIIQNYKDSCTYIYHTILQNGTIMFAVVEFMGVHDDETSGEIAIVPLIWLTKNEKKCYWPNRIKQTSTFEEFVKNQTPYKRSWSIYKVFKVHLKVDSYDKAEKDIEYMLQDVMKENECSNSSTISLNRKLFEDKDCSSESMDDSPPPKKLHLIETIIPAVSKLNDFSGCQQSASSSSRNSLGCTSSPRSNNVERQDSASPITSSSRNSESMSFSLNPEFERTVLGCLTKLSENVDQHSIILNELLRNSRQSNGQSVIPPEGELMPDFPLKCLKDFQQFDEKLLPDTALTKYMILRLSAVGGSGIESQTRRILKFLISNEVACHFNWKGRDKLSFEKTKIMSVIYDACKRNYPPNARNDLLIANAVKDWLKYGKARMTYKKKSC